MTKKQQNRTRGFGRRSLSALLAVLIVLSLTVMALMASATAAGNKTITVGVVDHLGSGSGYQVHYWGGSSGNGDATVTSANRTEQKSVGSAYWNNAAQTFNMFTAQIPSDATGFKIHNGNTWFGDDGNASTYNAAYVFEYSNVYHALYATVSTPDPTTAPTTAPDDPTPSGDADYTVGVGTVNGGDIFWADAYYYDYLSDTEVSSGWLNPSHVGTGYNGSQDEWYPFYLLNREVVKKVADSNSSWDYPLYFGNFCNTYKAYDDTGNLRSHHVGVTDRTGYADATDSYNVTRFNYAVNNSNGVYDMYTSVQGLMGQTLKNGKLQTPNGTIAPYFDKATLGDKAKVIKSKFPFRKINEGSYMRYEFDSTGAKDNVYFGWNGSTPTSVNYGAGTAYGVKDGIKEFMNTESGYGIFPFNRHEGQSNGGNNQLDYGFGIRMDMKFRVPANTDVSFDFSGDDDLWMYITDEDGNSQLVLDMGGNHKMSTGKVNFNNAVATVNKVNDPHATNNDIFIMEKSGWGDVKLYAWDNNNNGEWYEGVSSSNLYRFHENLKGSKGNPLSTKTKFLYAKNTNYDGQSADLNLSDYKGKCIYTNDGSSNTDNTVIGNCKSVTTPFNFDPNKTYTMTIFYMERGLLESNCKMGFTITPLGNNFIVTEKINTANVNDGLKDVVKQLSKFGFKTYNGGSQISDSTYRDFLLGNEESAHIGDSVLPMNSTVQIRQYKPSTSYLDYTTAWQYWDNEGVGGPVLLDSGTVSNTSTQTIINPSGNTYDYAELQVDYENTPQVTDLKVTKVVNDPGVDHSGETFPATLYLQFTSDSAPTAYTVQTSAGQATNGALTLTAGETVTIPGVPVGTRAYVVEDVDTNEYTVTYNCTSSSPLTVVSGSEITVTNTPVIPDAIMGDIDGMVKKLNGVVYDGDMFLFKLEGVNTGSPGDVDTSGMAVLETTDVSNGLFSFDNLRFNQPGTYRYRMYEDTGHLALIDRNNELESSFATDFVSDDKSYLVAIEVTKNGSDLHMGNPVYYNYDGSGPVTAADFSDDKITAEVVFYNTMKNGSVRVEKKDQNGALLNGVTFQVIKLDNYIAGLSGDEAEIYDEVKAHVSTHPELIAGSGTTGEDAADGTPGETGYAQIRNLSIYEDGFVTTNPDGSISIDSGMPTYQMYLLIESDVPDGYALNKTVNRFSFPINGSYDFTFSGADAYINGTIKSPSSGGVNHIVYIGLGIVSLAAVLLAAYVIVMKKRGFSFISFRK